MQKQRHQNQKIKMCQLRPLQQLFRVYWEKMNPFLSLSPTSSNENRARKKAFYLCLIGDF
jgi:hypothetical protein